MELKYLSGVVKSITKTIMVVENKKFTDAKYYVKSHKKVVDTNVSLFKTAGI